MTRTLTIPGVETVHTRETWEPDGFRMATDFDRRPPAADWSRADRGAIHYTSAINLPDGDPGEILTGIDGIRRLLARTTIDYLTNRDDGGYRRLSDGILLPGYPVGYNFAVDWLGGVWELRGWDFMPAATSGHNGHTIAILMLTDRADPASPQMLRSARMIQRECNRRRAHLADRPWAHGWFKERTGSGTRTSCCGPAMKAQIDAGLLDIDHIDAPAPPDPTTPPEDTDMTTQAKPYRVYDSRADQQHHVRSDFITANADVPKTPFKAGETRELVVGMVTEVYLNVTAIGGGAPGYFSVNDPAGSTSLIGFDAVDRVETNGAPVLAPDGKIKLTCMVNPAHVAVDVYATKP